MEETSLAKVGIQRVADERIDQALSRVNEGFEGGRVSKTDFLSWLIVDAVERLDDATIDEIRKAHFNQVAYLDGLVKRLKVAQRNNLTDDERALLKVLFESGTVSGKRGRRAKNQEKKNVADGQDDAK
jgi:hypothetical protein